MQITEREKRTLLYIFPLILLLLLILYVLSTKSPIFQSKNIGCIICHPLKAYSSPHPPYAKVACLSCHKKHEDSKSGKSVLIQKMPDLCYQCHQKVAKGLNDLNVHKPYSKGICLTCHSAHGSNNSYMFLTDPGSLCRSCHFMASMTPLKDQHKPFASGWCIACHSGHSSNIAANLKSTQKVLCLSCHQSVALEIAKPIQMEPFIEGKCTGCHNPHSSNNKRQLQKPLVELCISCHQEVGDQLENTSAHPVVKKKLITCLNCHMPHGSWYAKLLQRPFDKGVAGCGGCHVPHGSQSRNLIKANTSDGLTNLCEQCHVKNVYDMPYTHPVKNKFDTNAKKELSCVSTCHTNLYWPDMDIFDNEICITCHTGHNSPEAGMGSDYAKKTKLLRSSVKSVANKSWQETPGKNTIIQAPEVKIQAPPGTSKIKNYSIVSSAAPYIGEYHRLPNSDQYKIKKDKGCMLCHDVAELP